ncbi:glycosyltransferase [Sphingomonas sp. TREG-RG-20F-R18-01]|uniref:glycosyltransferase family 4 protein n=1 Tax=Sphingomonas sp. TREG-RG-20F-R18-01 TaxID=2914982 RepID=UPI001F5A68A9|nr:glycosyltransferase [Sphingomonas sp. TREG-RG-20F-R18-01]
MVLIKQPYLLVLNIELVKWGGRYWAEPLWHKDLMLHLANIDALTLLCPVREGPPPQDWLACSDSRLSIVGVRPLGYSSVLRIPQLVAAIWNAVGRHEIIHTGVAGWPFPIGWVAVPIAWLRRRFLVIVVESSFWRAASGKSSPWARAKAGLFETINRFCIRLASASFFTTEAYATDLGRSAHGFKTVSPASWIDDSSILSHAAITARGVRAEQRLLYAGRLTAEKGVNVLLQAIERSDAAVDIMGDGDLRDACRAVAERHPQRVQVLAPVPYGPAFYETLDRYAAVIVPTLSDEQPRIIVDAFARGVPVIASATSGNVGFVTHQRYGWIVQPDDCDQLAETMTQAIADPSAGLTYGLNARERIAPHTHSAMHARRAADIAREFTLRLPFKPQRAL